TTAFNNRLNKVSLAVRNLMRLPDVLGVEEMENISTLQSVATKINNDEVAAGHVNPNYQAYLVEGNDVGGIDVGFLVKSTRVNVVDVTQIELAGCTHTAATCNTYLNPNTGQQELLNDRPPLVLRATIQRPDNSTLAFTDLVNPDLTDLIDTLPAAQKYSYSFDGNAQVLDHVITNPNALMSLNRFAYARNDADFPVKYYEDGTRSERESDHDMPVAF